MQDAQGRMIDHEATARPERPVSADRPRLAAPLLFVAVVGAATLALLYIGARQFVVPMLFLSLPVATLWLIVNNRRRRD